MRVLVVAAHPDDEVLGIGGTMRRHALEGHEVKTVIVCEGVSVRNHAALEDQEAQARQAAAVLGSKLDFWGLEDQHLDVTPQIVLNERLEAVLDEWRPAVVYTHFAGDPNLDHRIVAGTVLVATRPNRQYIEGVYAFEPFAATGVLDVFHPDTFVDVAETLQTKMDAFRCYTTEVEPYPHPRSLAAVRARAMAWGSLVEMLAAEPLMTVRRLWRER